MDWKEVHAILDTYTVSDLIPEDLVVGARFSTNIGIATFDKLPYSDSHVLWVRGVPFYTRGGTPHEFVNLLKHHAAFPLDPTWSLMIKSGKHIIGVSHHSRRWLSEVLAHIALFKIHLPSRVDVRMMNTPNAPLYRIASTIPYQVASSMALHNRPLRRVKSSAGKTWFIRDYDEQSPESLAESLPI